MERKTLQISGCSISGITNGIASPRIQRQRSDNMNITLKNNDGEIFIDLPPNHWASEFSRRSLFLIDENLFLTEQIRAPEQLHQHEAFCCLLLTLNRSSPT